MFAAVVHQRIIFFKEQVPVVASLLANHASIFLFFFFQTRKPIIRVNYRLHFDNLEHTVLGTMASLHSMSKLDFLGGARNNSITIQFPKQLQLLKQEASVLMQIGVQAHHIMLLLIDYQSACLWIYTYPALKNKNNWQFLKIPCLHWYNLPLINTNIPVFDCTGVEGKTLKGRTHSSISLLLNQTRCKTRCRHDLDFKQTSQVSQPL